jgi:hypothetical protein
LPNPESTGTNHNRKYYGLGPATAELTTNAMTSRPKIVGMRSLVIVSLHPAFLTDFVRKHFLEVDLKLLDVVESGCLRFAKALKRTISITLIKKNKGELRNSGCFSLVKRIAFSLYCRARWKSTKVGSWDVAYIQARLL